MKLSHGQSHENEIANRYSIKNTLIICLDFITCFNINFFPISERAAVDASYIDEIDGLFKEANIIENFLVQKREFLKQRFTVITNTLHK